MPVLILRDGFAVENLPLLASGAVFLLCVSRLAWPCRGQQNASPD
jgi:hypothetical protein